MCKYGTNEAIYVKIPADLSASGFSRWKWASIDSCIASLVDALQSGGVDMRGSCCGHGGDFGSIALQDGRLLVITTESVYYRPWRFALAAFLRALKQEWRKL